MRSSFAASHFLAWGAVKPSPLAVNGTILYTNIFDSPRYQLSGFVGSEAVRNHCDEQAFIYLGGYTFVDGDDVLPFFFVFSAYLFHFDPPCVRPAAGGSVNPEQLYLNVCPRPLALWSSRGCLEKPQFPTAFRVRGNQHHRRHRCDVK